MQQAKDLAEGLMWIALSLGFCWGQFLLSVKRRRALSGTGTARGTVMQVIRHGRRSGWPDYRPVIEFVTSEGERVQFEDATSVREYDDADRREFEVAYDPADPSGTAVAVRKWRWRWSWVIAVPAITMTFIAGIVCLVQGIIFD
jgi:hypothetical protein